MTLSKTALLEASDLREKDVDLPELGETGPGSVATGRVLNEAQSSATEIVTFAASRPSG